ncbi:HEAT repeat domain-containing protein [Ramlibacter tataouinensis]|uniref:HEAT repeat domain-containing protein n=1 Tax=Ramlibacter tataouinensis (strain ATCC BAA-407 / DSM 14655 / LMG 21543 / TTB310) TaxID=365046 RepID=F5Y0M6_RAMTT|nr:HEAT repeat domain-containing protein [Ramlibacter tataouinensis]AEG93432.1 Conserved hypothetical protein [Ramlibacter tataouinensis TTB310]
MGSSSLSDPYLIAAFWAGVVATALVLLVCLLIVGLRLASRRREARWQRFVALWRPALLSVVAAEDAGLPLPPLRRRDGEHFLRLWLYLQESLRGGAADQLNEVALRLQVPDMAQRMLSRGSRPGQLLATLALGSLRHRPAWEALLRTAGRPLPLLSVNAARALVQIDPLAAAQQLMPLILSRHDWDTSRVASFLAGGRQAFWLLLVKVLPSLPPPEALRGLRLAEALRLQLPPRVLRTLLDPRRRPEVIWAALPLAHDDQALQAVRPLLAHPTWQVRQQATTTLARLAGPDDVPALAALLEDGRFEVRLAAARGLAALPFLRPDDLRQLQLQRPGGRDVVRHVLADLEAAA